MSDDPEPINDETPPPADPDPVDDEPVDDEPVELSDEDRARLTGWKDVDEFKGNPEDHRDAAAYLEMRDGNLKVTTQNLKVAEKRIAKLEKSAARAEKFQEQNKAILRDTIEQEIQSAFDSGEKEQFQAAREKLAKIDAPEPVTPDVDPAVTSFQERNLWYGTDDAKTLEANGTSAKLAVMHPGWTVAQNLAEVDRLMNETPARRKAPALASSRKRTPVQRTGFNTLDDDQKANFTDDVRRGTFKDDDASKKRYYESVMKYQARKAQ